MSVMKLLVNKVLLPKLLELFERFAPIVGNAARILSARDRVISRLIGQQLDHSFHVVLRGIEFVQRGSQLQAQLRPVESVAIYQQNVNALALLSGVHAGA